MPMPAAGQGLDRVLLRLGEQRYAIPLTAVREVLPLPLLSRPPRMPAILDGFLHLDRIAVAVVNLARLFDLPDAPPALYTPLLLVRGNSKPIALRVEQVLGVVSISQDSEVQLDEHWVGNECAEGAAVLGNRVVVLLAPQRILLKQERDCLADLQAAEQQRLDALREAAP
jgi:purine-binding chemotaxis protein CheW